MAGLPPKNDPTAPAPDPDDSEAAQRRMTAAALDAALRAVTATANTARRASSNTAAAASRGAAGIVPASQALLASGAAGYVNRLAAAAVKGPATIYDKAMDANFMDPLLRPNLGGSYHRLFDGGHTIGGAFKAARAADSDDSLLQETLGALRALLKDASTPRGLPLGTWSKDTFDSVGGRLSSFGIPKQRLYDVNTCTIADVASATVGMVSVAYNWNRADTESFARIAAGIAVSTACRANPLLLVVALVSAARSFDKARRGADYSELADGALKGGATAAATAAAVGVTTAAGGPAGVALLVGATVGILASKATSNVSLGAVAGRVRSLSSEGVPGQPALSSREIREARTEAPF